MDVIWCWCRQPIYYAVSNAKYQSRDDMKNNKNTDVTDDNTRPLDDYLIVCIEQAVSAPYCSRLLADQGARVIKIERPDGGDFARKYDERVDGEASHFVWLNRSKESLALNLKNPKSIKIVRNILLNADVFVQNLAPGAIEKLGLDPVDLRAENSKLITCSISGFGEGGPYNGRKAYDLLVQAEVGLLSITGDKDNPAKAGISIADICTGVTAYHSILAALLKRGRTGKGDHIDVSMLEATADWMGYPMYFAYDGAPPPARAGAGHATIFPYGPFKTSDGDVLFGLQNDREWISFCEVVLLRKDMATDERFRGNAGRAEHKIEIEKVINSRLMELTKLSAIQLLEEAGIGTAEVRDMEGLWQHPQLKARDCWTQVDSPIGMIPALKPISGNSWQAKMEAIPKVGQHTQNIINEFTDNLQDDNLQNDATNAGKEN